MSGCPALHQLLTSPGFVTAVGRAKMTCLPLSPCNLAPFPSQMCEGSRMVDCSSIHGSLRIDMQARQQGDVTGEEMRGALHGRVGHGQCHALTCRRPR